MRRQLRQRVLEPIQKRYEELRWVEAPPKLFVTAWRQPRDQPGRVKNLIRLEGQMHAPR